MECDRRSFLRESIRVFSGWFGLPSAIQASTSLYQRATLKFTDLRTEALIGGLISPSASPKQSLPSLPVFINETARAGITFRHHGNPTPDKYPIETMCGGVGLLDYDNDGLLDIFFVNGGSFYVTGKQGRIDRSKPEDWNRLYHNNGDGTFTDVTEKAGVSGANTTGFGMGVAVADYDNDGFSDIYVTNFGKNILYHNNGDGTFTDVTDKAGVAASGWSVSAGFLDYNNDGRLDLFVGRYLDWDFSTNVYCGEPIHSYCPPYKYLPMTNILYHNNGDGTFTDVSQQAGIAAKPGTAMGVGINDYDGDGFPDIFVSNDDKPHFLYHNNGNGAFTERGLQAGVAYNENGSLVSGMGVTFNDYDNDGLPDIVVTDLASEIFELYRNTGSGSFDFLSRQTGLEAISAVRSGWGVEFADYDNDGWKDLFISESHVLDNIEMIRPQFVYKLPPLLLRNCKGKFVDVSAQSGRVFEEPFAGRGLAVGDLDNDGSVDAIINVLNGSPLLLYNNASKLGNHWLTIKLVGTASNRDGQGAAVMLQGKSGLKQWQYATTCGSYLSAQDPRIHFGLGSDESAAKIEIRWPSGMRQVLENVNSNQILTVTEPRKGTRQ